MPGPWELWIVLFIVVLLFGASRIPKLARGLGEGVSEFKKGMKEGGTESDEDSDAPPTSIDDEPATSTSDHQSERKSVSSPDQEGGSAE